MALRILLGPSVLFVMFSVKNALWSRSYGEQAGNSILSGGTTPMGVIDLAWSVFKDTLDCWIVPFPLVLSRFV